MTSRWGSDRVLVHEGGYREGPTFEERPRSMPRPVRRAIAGTIGLLLVRLPWLALFAFLMHFLFGRLAVVLALPGVLLWGRLAWTALALARNRPNAGELARGSADWLRVQQIAVFIAGTCGALACGVELALCVAIASLLPTWGIWRVAWQLTFASSVLEDERRAPG